MVLCAADCQRSSLLEGESWSYTPRYALQCSVKLCWLLVATIIAYCNYPYCQSCVIKASQPDVTLSLPIRVCWLLQLPLLSVLCLSDVCCARRCCLISVTLACFLVLWSGCVQCKIFLLKYSVVPPDRQTTLQHADLLCCTACGGRMFEWKMLVKTTWRTLS